jgi:hypothetical protein
MNKPILLSLITLFLISCGKSPAEQMLYDYQQKNVGALNFDLNDLDFQIIKIEKVGEVTASDSMAVLKKELAELWKDNPEQSLIDTLSFVYAMEALSGLVNNYERLFELSQEMVLLAIRLDDYADKFEYTRQRDSAIVQMVQYQSELRKISRLEEYYNRLVINPDSVLSVKYRANYALRNPILGNARQVFNKVFYTNQSQTEFIKEETLD